MFENLNYINYKYVFYYLVIKTMVDTKICKNCSHISDCQKVYHQLGQSKGPSVVVKVITAFLLPLLVFIGCLAAFELIFSTTINKRLQTPLSVLFAISVTFFIILIIKAINKRADKNRQI